MNQKQEFYEKNLERVNYWLQFAETKNAAVIAYDVAILAVIYSSEIAKDRGQIIVLTLVFALSLSIAFASLFPRYMKNVNIACGAYDMQRDNYLFWNDIAKYSAQDYWQYVNKALWGEETEATVSAMEMMYIGETIANARIAKYKYQLFRKSVIVAIIGTVLIPAFLFIMS